MIAALPDELADLLNDASPAADAATDQQVKAFIDEHRQASRPETLAGLTSALRNRFEAGESRHQSTATVTVGAMKEARLGLYPAQAAIDAIAPMFLHAVAKPPISGKQGAARNGAVARSEFHGILAWSVGQALGADLDEIQARVDEKMPNTEWGKGITVNGEHPNVQPISLTDAHTVFKRWLGDDYDTDALDAQLSCVAVERFNDGSDPPWLLIISGPGNAKTETVQSLDGSGATITSAISSEAALLSATPKRERAKDATGGLLRKIGDRGVLVIKDVTSILSMDRNIRARVLAALREVYDGRWYREVGVEGGRTIEWTGRIVVVGAVTTAWDTAHAVVSTMGDRFILVRIDSAGDGRRAAGWRAIRNTGDETKMRAELAAAVAGVINGMNHEPITLTDDETDTLLAAADLVTRARTGVEYDYRGDVIDAHAPEMPTRFAKQLTQIVRGAVAIGMNRQNALRLAIRCARDSMPPLRLAIIDHLAANPGDSTAAVRKGIDKPRATVDRQLQALHMLGVLDVDEVEYQENKFRWYYTLAEGISPDAIKPGAIGLNSSPDLLPPTYRQHKKESGTGGQEQEEGNTPQGVTHISGEGCEVCDQELLHPASIERRICERCYLTNKRGGDTTAASAS